MAHDHCRSQSQLTPLTKRGPVPLSACDSGCAGLLPGSDHAHLHHRGASSTAPPAEAPCGCHVHPILRTQPKAIAIDIIFSDVIVGSDLERCVILRSTLPAPP